MKLFKPATNTQAYAKVGIMGFAGSGKTYTATEFAIGLVEHMRNIELEIGNRPAVFLDTETGSDWVTPKFKGAEIDIFTAKTRAFSDLVPAIKEAEQEASVMIIDSISHFWKDLTESYMRKKNRTRLQFQDWNVLKTEWGRFTDVFVNSDAHIILCGRAGYEYDYFEDDAGKKELHKTGVKMKAETETGYEPSLLMLMERVHDMETNKVHRTCDILKDRSTYLDGKQFINPKFEDFKQHIDFLNLGGKQLGVDTERNSDDMFDDDGQPEWKRKKLEKEILLDETKELLIKHHPSSSGADKKAKGDLLEKHFGTRSWARLENSSLDAIQHGYEHLYTDLEIPKVDEKEELPEKEAA